MFILRLEIENNEDMTNSSPLAGELSFAKQMTEGVFSGDYFFVEAAFRGFFSARGLRRGFFRTQR